MREYSSHTRIKHGALSLSQFLTLVSFPSPDPAFISVSPSFDTCRNLHSHNLSLSLSLSLLISALLGVFFLSNPHPTQFLPPLPLLLPPSHPRMSLSAPHLYSLLHTSDDIALQPCHTLLIRILPPPITAPPTCATTAASLLRNITLHFLLHFDVVVVCYRFSLLFHRCRDTPSSSRRIALIICLAVRATVCGGLQRVRWRWGRREWGGWREHVCDGYRCLLGRTIAKS